MAQASDSTVNPRRGPIAVVGVSALFPGSAGAGGFWRDILAGRDLITDIPESHWLIEDYYDPDPKAPDKTYAKRGSFLSPTDFDPLAYGIPPTIAPATDSAQLLALIVAQQVLEDAAQGQFDELDRSRISVILGVTSAQELLATMVGRLQRPVWIKALRESGFDEARVEEICDRIADNYIPWQESTFPGLLGNVVAGRIANRFNLGGTNCVTDAACASAFASVSMAANELHLGDSDLVIAGGVDTLNDIFMYMCFSKTPALSPTGDCRPFSDQADGTLLGEGLGLVALKRLADAERDGDCIYAVIKGVGSSSDGRAKSVYAPLPAGQAKALTRAYEQAGHGPETVELVEAHGTATKAGDAAEFEGLRLAFDGNGRGDRQWCALGSVKSQIGHTKSAAGAAGLFKAVMALHHGVLPPTIKVERPNPALELESSPFYLNTEPRPWIRGGDHPRRASVSSFGFGGSNFHLALEEYRGPGKRAPRFRTSPRTDANGTHANELVVFGASTAGELAQRCSRLSDAAGHPGSLTWLAADSQRRYDGGARRLAIVATNEDDLRTKLRQAAERLRDRPDEAFAAPGGIYYGVGGKQRKIAFLFPGQGSQYPGMGADLAMAFEPARDVWDRAADLSLNGGIPLHNIVFPRPAFSGDERQAQNARLTATEWAQPAIGAASLSQLALLEDLGIRADCVGGHSYGEITALAAAGVMTPAAMLRVARRRGELMREASAERGAMTAVSAAPETLEPLLETWGNEVTVANHNAPEQVVLSGRADAIDEVERRLDAEGIRCRRVAVSAAFHSPLVAGSTAPFLEFLGEVEIATPAVDVYSNAEAAPYPTDPGAIRRRLAEQIAKPVRFVYQLEAMVERGIDTFLEVGPGSVLTSLVGKILQGRDHLAVSLDRKGRDGVTSLWHALGQLVAAGVAVDFESLWQGIRPPADPAAAEKPKMTLQITGSNYGKLYPPPGGAAALPAPNPPEPETADPAPRPAVAARVQATPIPTEQPTRPAMSSESKIAASPPVATAPTAPAPTAPAPDPAPASDLQLAWVQAYQETQRQTADAHAAYQRSMAEAQTTFLKTMESSFAHLGGLLSGQPPAGAGETPALPATPAGETPALPAAPVGETPALPVSFTAEAPVIETPIVEPAVQPAIEPAIVQPPATVEPPAAVEPVAAPVEPAPSQAPVAVGADLQALMLEVVADKTGYPVEMLSLEMDMEADLGIDSIKRVEILSAMREREPALPEVDTARMAEMRTLGQIVDMMGEGSGAAAPASGATQVPEAEQASPATPAATTASGPGAEALQALMLEVVADKTGYPVEMLDLDMDMEADLGIDSIKRVEILSAMRDREPALPEVDTARMAEMRTLGQIVDMMDGGAAETAAEPVPGADTPDVSPPAPALGAQASRLPPETPTIGRFALREVDAPAAGLALAGLVNGGRIAVTDDGGGVAAALVERLTNRGLAAKVVGEVPSDAAAVVFLGGLRSISSFAQGLAVEREAFRAAKAVAARFTAGRGAFVTVQDTGGDFGLAGGDATRASLGGLAGLAKTAAREWPGAAIKAIDLERGARQPAALAEALERELLEGGAELEVGLHADGRRTTLESYAAPLPSGGSTPLSKESVLVASGGARGVTAATLIALARAAQPRMVLLGRTALEPEPEAFRGLEDEADLRRALLEAAKTADETLTPRDLAARAGRVRAGREIRATLEALAAAGSEARYVSADVRDTESLTAALEPVRREWGPITGLVHGAGVIADKAIAEKTEEQFDRVFDTKVEGLRCLLEATANDPLELLVFFSSVTARSGNTGQSDYAMANEVLNKVAAVERRRRGVRAEGAPSDNTCRVKSLNWGPWEGGMVTPELEARFAELGVPLIPLEAGARLLVDEVSAGGDAAEQVEVVLGGSPQIGPSQGAGEVSMDAIVSRSSHAFLDSHVVAGAPVLPVVLALEWFHRLAHAHRPDLEVVACRDVKVLSGIRLERFDGGAEAFHLNSRLLTNGSGCELAVTLSDPDGRPRYSAMIDMAEPGDHQQPGQLEAPTFPRRGTNVEMLEPWPAEIYGDALFHGPALQVIRELEGVSGDSIAGVLAGGAEMGWGGGWQLDAAVLDGGLQLAVLWFQHMLEGASLPLAVGSLRTWKQGPLAGPVRAVARCHVRDSNRVVSDVMFSNGDGRVIAELTGVEIVRRPDGAGASTAEAVHAGA